MLLLNRREQVLPQGKVMVMAKINTRVSVILGKSTSLRAMNMQSMKVNRSKANKKQHKCKWKIV